MELLQLMRFVPRLLLQVTLAALLGLAAGRWWEARIAASPGGVRTADAWLASRAAVGWTPQAGRSDLVELPAAELARLLAERPFASFDPSLALAFRRLAKLDPACALELAATRGDRESVAVRVVLRTLAPEGAQALEARLLQAAPDARIALGLAWIDRLLAARQPDEALDFATRAELLDFRLEAIFREFRSQSLARALRAAEQVPPGSRSLALGGALFSAHDPLASIGALLPMQDMPERERWLRLLLADAIKLDPAETLALIARVEPAYLRAGLLSHALGWAPRGARETVRSWWLALPEAERHRYRGVVLNFEAEIEPTRVLEALQTDDVDDKVLLWRLCGKVVRKAPEAVRAWAVRLPPGPQRLALVHAWMQEAVGTAVSYDHGLQLLPELPAVTGQEWAEAAGPLRRWFRQDPIAVIEWIRSRGPLSRCEQLERLARSKNPSLYR